MIKEKISSVVIALCMFISLAAEASSNETLEKSKSLRKELASIIGMYESNQSTGNESNASFRRKLGRQNNSYLEPGIVSSSIAGNIQARPVREDNPLSEHRTLVYEPEKTDEIYTRKGFVTDIKLMPGETLKHIVLGDSERFNYTTYFDNGYPGVWHIYLQPLQMGIETNLMINTDMRSYALRVGTSDLYNAVVSWQCNLANRSGHGYAGRDKGHFIEVASVKDLNFGYAKKARKKFSWAPGNIFDDKSSTIYLNFPRGILEKINPLILGSHKSGTLKIVDYEKYDSYIVIREIYDYLDFCVGDEHIHIIRKEE